MIKPARGSVLLADDEAGILKTLGRALREDGHEVVATASAAEAERLLRSARSTPSWWTTACPARPGSSCCATWRRRSARPSGRR